MSAVAGIGRRTLAGGRGVAGAGGQRRQALKGKLQSTCCWGGACGKARGWRGHSVRPPSETTSLALASRSAAAAFFARMDVQIAAMGGGDDGGGGDVVLLAATRADR